jgi:T5SS/PEP-CTERM-associated repeat protein
VTTAYIAQQIGSVGMVRVDGSGSRLSGGTIYVGGSESSSGGTANLTVVNHAKVEVSSRLLLREAGTIDIDATSVVTLGTLEHPPEAGRLSIGKSGTLLGVGTVNGKVDVRGGGLAPGFHYGALSVNGDVFVDETSYALFQVGSTAGYARDQLLVAGDLTIRGTIRLSLLNGFQPQLGDELELMHVVGGITDLSAARWEMTKLSDHLAYEPFVEGETAGLRIVAAASAADFDQNGIVDIADYQLWKQTFGSTSLLGADGNRNGVVDLADYTVWRDNLGATVLGGGTRIAGNEVGFATTVPEPATVIVTLGLAGIVALSGYLRRVTLPRASNGSPALTVVRNL